MSRYHDDPADSQQLDRARRERETSSKREAESEASDIKWLMGQRRGRRIAYRMLSQSGVYRTTFSTNALSMSFAEGRRQCGLELMAMLTEHCPERYMEMLKEANNVRDESSDGDT